MEECREEISTRQGAVIAGALIGGVAVTLLSVCDILPRWVFDVMMLAVWVGVVWHYLRALQRKLTRNEWFRFVCWESLVIFVVAVVSNVVECESLLDKVLLSARVTLFAVACLALAYLFIYRNREQQQKKK